MKRTEMGTLQLLQWTW